jgi:hypothetical protein
MKKPLLLAFAAALGLQVKAQTYTPITLTGYTADVIANGTGTAVSSTSTDVDGEGYNFVAQDYKNPANQTPNTFLPGNGTITSAVTSSVSFQLAPYTGNNSLRITSTSGPGTLTFATPRSADEIYVLVTTAYGATFTATVNYTDGTSQAFNGNAVPNWFFGTGNIAIQGVSRVFRSTDAIENSNVDPRMYQFLFTPNTANLTKLIQSITFTKTTTGVKEILHVFGVTTRAVLANDVSVTAINGLGSGCGLTSQENVCVTIKNGGSAPQSNFPVRYTLNSGTPITENFTGTLAPGATTSFCFAAKANLSTAGTYTIQACTGLATDQATGNDCATKAVTSIPTISTFPYVQNFEAGNGGWVSGGTSSSWALGTPAKTVINSAASGTKSWITGLTGTYNASEKSQVESPCFNFSSLVQPLIEMKVWWNSEFSYDGAVLQSSIDGGATWQVVGAKGDPNNWYNDNTINGGPGGQPVATAIGWTGRNSTNNGSGGWVTVKHTLTGLGGQAAVRLRIAFGSEASVQDNGFAFDDIMVYDTPANDGGVSAIISPNSGCGLSNLETVTITVKNYGTAALSNIPVSFTVDGGAPVNEVVAGPIAPNTTANYTFTAKANLSANGSHTIVASTNIAGDGLMPNNASTKVVTTVPTISILPYTEGFENGNGGWMAGGTLSSWALGTPAKTVINSAASGTKAWVTGLTSDYNANEKSYVVGPCFNFSGVADPDFEMKVWWQSEFSFDGAVLQSSIDGGATWQVVGAKGDPNNWYNDNSISGAPGDQPGATAVGWTGRNITSNGSGTWVKVKHKLTGLGGKPSVRLRIAFGAEAYTQDNGFAFDDIRIGDNTNNLAVNSITPINKVCGFSATETISAVIENLGSVAASGFTVSYTIDGGAAVTQNFTGSLAGGATSTFTFTQKANLSGTGNHNVVVTVNKTGDPEAANNSATYNLTNASFPGLPPVFNFETAATGLTQLGKVTKTKSNVVEDPAASNGAGSTKGLILDGVANTAWTVPAGTVNPWTVNPENFAAVYICFNPSAAPATLPLWLSFDLKQLFKTANANTNFRVTVNGNQVGPTYRPPFSGTPINWQTINVDLSSYKNLTGVQIGLESSVKEAYAAGAGTANLVDNITFGSAPLGVKANVLASQVDVFPNPSTGTFNVSLPAGKTYQLEVTDLSGKKILDQEAKGDAQLNMEGIAKGVYLLQVTSGNGSAVRKLIVE